jgi:hypothetical protein
MIVEGRTDVRDRLLRVLTVALVTAAAAAPDVGASGVVVAQVPGATGLTAYAGHVVWSQPDPATGRWRLMQWHDGRVTRLAVGSRRVSFDADAGPDARGHPVVVYSRCRHEPPYVYYTAPDWSLASGCDLYETSLVHGTTQRIRAVSTRAASETTPSIWRGSIAFARRGPRSPFARLLLYDRVHHRISVLAGGTEHADARRPSSRSGAPSALDLGPRAVAFNWLLDDPLAGGNDGREWQLWIVSRRSGRSRELDTGLIGECGSVLLNSPNAVGLGAEWIASSNACGMDGGIHEYSDIVSYHWSRGETTHVRTDPFGVALTRDGATEWLLSTPGVPQVDYPSGQAIPVDPGTCVGPGLSCSLVRVTGAP